MGFSSLTRKFQRCQGLLAGNRRVVFEELLQVFSRLQRIEEVLQWNPRAHKDRHASLNLGVTMNDRLRYDKSSERSKTKEILSQLLRTNGCRESIREARHRSSDDQGDAGLVF